VTIANARMYSATPRVKHAGQRLLRWVLDDAALQWELIDYDAPEPLNALWARDDLGLAMMCGLPCAVSDAASARSCASRSTSTGRCFAITASP